MTALAYVVPTYILLTSKVMIELLKQADIANCRCHESNDMYHQLMNNLAFHELVLIAIFTFS